MTDEMRHTIYDWEGGEKVTNIPADLGGLTKFGIAQRSHPGVDIANLTFEGACEIYVREYWAPLRLDDFTSVRIRWKVWDMAVQQGPQRAAHMLQRALGFGPDAIDGVVGTKTLEAVNACTNELRLLVDISHLQQKHYVSNVVKDHSQLTFLSGWINRSQDLGESLSQD